jgi:hypothetical protein
VSEYTGQHVFDVFVLRNFKVLPFTDFSFLGKLVATKPDIIPHPLPVTAGNKINCSSVISWQVSGPVEKHSLNFAAPNISYPYPF